MSVVIRAMTYATDDGSIVACTVKDYWQMFGHVDDRLKPRVTGFYSTKAAADRDARFQNLDNENS